jgi:hypothetical protein
VNAYLEAAPRRLVGRAAQEAQQPPLALEESAQHLGHREDHVAVRNGKQHDLDQERAQQRGALAQATRAEVARLAGETPPRRTHARPLLARPG